jgi:histidinol dehydrogenase
VKIISDFHKAKSVLQRATFDLGKAPIEVKRRIKEAFAVELTPEEAVCRIIDAVRDKGDGALVHFTWRLDGIALESLEVSEQERREAYGKVDRQLISALNIAAERVRSFHQAQLRHSFKEFIEGGVGQTVSPLEKVGVYAPGGTACYPSTVLMTAIPARVAGVEEIILTTPPGSGGIVPPATLVAADIAEVDRVFKVGGAQAIAALAYGTWSIPRVDKVCGPGGLFVTLAKRLVCGAVAIDGLAGPTETLILADDSASPDRCAADLLAQAEHDMLATALLITTSSKLAKAVDKEVRRQLEGLDRSQIARRSLDERGKIIVVSDMEQAIELINIYAPEHVSLMVRDAPSYIERIRHAGAIFIGENSPGVLGDYVAGPSHVLPTGGTARFCSSLGVNDFLKITSIISLSDEDIAALGPAAVTIAIAEGLTAHARAAELRLKQGRIP